MVNVPTTGMPASRFFTADELRCKHTGELVVVPSFLAALDTLRAAFGRPIVVNSGYRSPMHPIERRKPSPGFHSKGVAADIRPASGPLRPLAELAVRITRPDGARLFTGIGVDPTRNYIHVDTGTRAGNARALWRYDQRNNILPWDGRWLSWAKFQ